MDKNGYSVWTALSMKARFTYWHLHCFLENNREFKIYGQKKNKDSVDVS
jgi:hypothetical protein